MPLLCVCFFPALGSAFPEDFHTHNFFFLFFGGWEGGVMVKGELLMSLERLPWEPVANESLGFPLHLEPRFLVIAFPWQRMPLIPWLAPGPAPRMGR